MLAVILRRHYFLCVLFQNLLRHPHPLHIHCYVAPTLRKGRALASISCFFTQCVVVLMNIAVTSAVHKLLHNLNHDRVTYGLFFVIYYI